MMIDNTDNRLIFKLIESLFNSFNCVIIWYFRNFILYILVYHYIVYHTSISFLSIYY